MRLTDAISIALVTYWTILVAELLGDKAVYTITSLASRYSPPRVYTGVTAAFMGKVLVAVLFAQLLLRVPAYITAAVSAAILFLTAAALWLKSPSTGPLERASNVASSPGGFGVAFAALFFSEWADAGQLSTAALSAHYRMPLVIWMGATAALMTKGLLALTLGIQLRKFVPNCVLRIAAAGSCFILGVVAMRTALLR